MKLRFDLLAVRAPAAGEESVRGRTGTAGTREFSGERLSPLSSKREGTCGDKAASVDGSGTAFLTCPLKSPTRPRGESRALPSEEAVSPPSPTVPAPSQLPRHDDGFDSEAFEERAAIMEFEGGLSRAAAEAAARATLARAYWSTNTMPTEQEN